MMSNIYNSYILLHGNRINHIKEILSRCYIKTHCWFVKDEQFGIIYKCPQNHDSLSLPIRQVSQAVPFTASEPGFLYKLGCHFHIRYHWFSVQTDRGIKPADN